MTVPIGNGGDQGKINVDVLQQTEQQQHRDQQRLEDEAARKINDEKKQQPEEGRGIASSNWHALPREVEKVIEKFAMMVGIQHALETSVATDRAGHVAHDEHAEPIADSAMASLHDSSMPNDQQSSIANVAEPGIGALPQSLIGVDAQQATVKHNHPGVGDASIPLTDRVADAVGQFDGADTSAIDGASTDGDNDQATSAKMERDQRLAAIAKQAADQDRGRDHDGIAPASLLQQLPTDQIIAQQPAQLPQQTPQQRFAKSSAERLAAIASAEQQPEGLKYNLKSWGGDQSVVVTGSAQSGYQARGSDRHVDRILKQYADASLPVSIEPSELDAPYSTGTSGATSSGNGKSIE